MFDRYDRPQRNSFRAPAEITKSNVTATVKWFNGTKGFGFVTPEDGSPDAFLHASALLATGHDSLPDGATVVVDLSRGPKGPQVATVHSVDTSTATPSRGGFGGQDRGGFDGRPSRGYDDAWGGGGASEIVGGTVKWFNGDKGFGFIAPDNGGKDVFVHINALRRSGMDGLRDGDRVSVTVRQGAKGPEAERVELG